VFEQESQDFPAVCEETQEYGRESAEKPRILQITTSSPLPLIFSTSPKCHRSTFSLSTRSMFQKVVRKLAKSPRSGNTGKLALSPSPALILQQMLVRHQTEDDQLGRRHRGLLGVSAATIRKKGSRRETDL
jgi:hypothetical protein